MLNQLFACKVIGLFVVCLLLWLAQAAILYQQPARLTPGTTDKPMCGAACTGIYLSGLRDVATCCEDLCCGMQ